MVVTPEFKERLRSNIDKHRDVLNRLESHLGCVTCRGPLVDGRCERCDGEAEA